MIFPGFISKSSRVLAYLKSILFPPVFLRDVTCHNDNYPSTLFCYSGKLETFIDAS